MLRPTILLIFVTGCPAKEEKPAEPAPSASGTSPAPIKPPEPVKPPEPPPPSRPQRIEGFQTPESVLHDTDADQYLVSNINGDPVGKDDNGFISRAAPDGKIVELKWIDGAKEDVTLNAPKGMAISGGVLWVADIDTLRSFDAKTGKVLKEYPVKGATFLNDVIPAEGGGVYVSDSGFGPGFEPSGSDAVYRVGADGKLKPVLKAKDMGKPNGLYAPGDGSLWVVTFGSGEIYQIDAKGKRGIYDKLPKGQLDGIVGLEGGEVLVSSWEGAAIYRGKPAEGMHGKAEPMNVKWTEVATGLKAPADIGFDSKRKRILVPRFQENFVEFHELK